MTDSKSKNKSRKSRFKKIKKNKLFIPLVISSISAVLFMLFQIYLMFLVASYTDRIDNLEKIIEEKQELIEEYKEEGNKVTEDESGEDEEDDLADEYEVDNTSQNTGDDQTDNTDDESGAFVPEEFPVNFKSRQVSAGISMTSEYITMTIPENWQLSALYSPNADMDQDDTTRVISEFALENSKGDQVIFSYVSVFGVTFMVPFKFEESESVIEAYYGRDSIASMISRTEDSVCGEIDCEKVEDGVVCDAQNTEYVDIKGVRILLLDCGIRTLNKIEDPDSWVYSDSIDWEFNESFYYGDFDDSWERDELEQLEEVVNSIEIH
jgi:hypothetical protein